MRLGAMNKQMTKTVGIVEKVENGIVKKEEAKAMPLFPLSFYIVIGKLKSTSKPPYSL